MVDFARVVILSYNHHELTSRAAQSALAFFPPEFVYIVHNGSAENCQNILSQRFPQCQHLILPDNRGYSGGANHGLNIAFNNLPQATWVLFMSNDCELLEIPSPETLPPEGLVTGLIYRRKTPHLDSAGALIDIKKIKLRHLRNPLEFHQTKSNSELIYIPGSSFLIHRNTFFTLGGFDESFGTYWEDVDLSLRALQAKQQLCLNNDFKVRHGIGKTCHKSKFYTQYLFHRNRKLLAKKHPTLFQQGSFFWVRENLKRRFSFNSLSFTFQRLFKD